jgi:hypothetical protein
LTEEDE